VIACIAFLIVGAAIGSLVTTIALLAKAGHVIRRAEREQEHEVFNGRP
jgi:hypothetical protein